MNAYEYKEDLHNHQKNRLIVYRISDARRGMVQSTTQERTGHLLGIVMVELPPQELRKLANALIGLADEIDGISGDSPMLGGKDKQS